MIFASGLAPHFAMTSMQDMKIKARSQLRISGLFPSAYWFGQALVDVALSWLLLFLMIAILFAFSYSFHLSFLNAVLLIVEVLGYGMAMVLYVYLITLVFGRKKIHHDRWSFFFILSSVIPAILLWVVITFPVEIYFLYLILVPPSSLMAFLIHLVHLKEDYYRVQLSVAYGHLVIVSKETLRS
ncbi:unnamed protein product [Staurois parvus]|uniref:Uncharacterized protein n=1 Tax=Staurois parvus TaxID=386267 RepID=A0ABN9FE22_9NEOB|nr:unnamed protein product [Staurois parvus]